MPDAACPVSTAWFLLSDAVLFLALQGMTILLVLVAAIRDALKKLRAGRGGPTLQIFRSANSMAVFYGAYVVATGLLVGIALSIEVVAGYRVFWVLLDTLLVAYLCLYNHWFRNWLIGRTELLARLEKS